MSSDGGTVWNLVDYFYLEGGCCIVHPDSAQIVLTGGEGSYAWTDRSFYVSVSRDSGSNWTRFNLSDSADGHCLALAAATGSGTVYAGGHIEGRGVLFRSADLGQSWERTGDVPPGTIRSLAVHPGNGDTVYAAAEGLFRSTDRGETWTCLFTLGWGEFNSVRINAEGPDTVVAAGAVGVAISTDGGGQWSLINAGLDTLEVNWLEFADRGATLIAATEGRSCYAWSLPTGFATGGTVGARGSRLAVRPNPVRVGVPVGVTLDGTVPRLVELRDAAGRLVRSVRGRALLGTAGLAAGVYYLAAGAGERRVRRTLVVAK